jgi:hypothetical protein
MNPSWSFEARAQKQKGSGVPFIPFRAHMHRWCPWILTDTGGRFRMCLAKRCSTCENELPDKTR